MADMAVVDALLNVARPLKVLVPVKVLFEYVFAIVVEASAKKVEEVVEKRLDTERRYWALVVEKRSVTDFQ